MAVLSLWLVCGLYLDGWAHRHVPGLETFFTPWHGVLYSGYAAAAAFLAINQLRGMRAGAGFRFALPAGYGLSLLGAAGFLLGGLGDLAWHELFGIEASIDALLSPTHLILACTMTLMVSGPVRSACAAPPPGPRWRDLWPAIVSLTLMLSVLTFFTEYANAFSYPNLFVEHRFGADAFQSALLIAGVLLQTVFTMGCILYGLRNWRWPVGGLWLLVSGNLALMGLFHLKELLRYPMVIGVIAVAGLLVELLARLLRPGSGRPAATRLFSFLAPVAMFTAYFATLLLTKGMWWSVHLWAGTIVPAGIAGVLVQVVASPPLSLAHRHS